MHVWRALLLSLLLVGPAWGQVESVMVDQPTTDGRPITNKSFDDSNTLDSVTITGTVPGGATFTAITLPNPTITGAISGTASWASPGAIGAGTPSAGTFTTVTATGCVQVGGTSIKICSGSGTPEGAVAASVGSLFLRSNGGTGTTFYIKESGTGNTGWVPFSTSSVTWATPGAIGSTTPSTGAFTTLSVTGQFTSTLSTGTAPLVIASTTKVTNLNVDLLDGGDWNAPGIIGGVTPNAIVGTTVASTGCMIVLTPRICSGTGSPEGVVTASVGSLFFRTDGSSGTTLYTKEAGSGNTGWAAMAPSTINWTSPGAIGSGTPDTGAFTMLTSTRRAGGTWSPTYGTTVSIDASLGETATISATNSTDFVISNPTNGVAGQDLYVRVKNTSGGVLGLITWDTAYKMASFTKPSNGTYRVVHFKLYGSTWVEFSCSPEAPNEP